jgi:hypothetical protein
MSVPTNSFKEIADQLAKIVLEAGNANTYKKGLENRAAIVRNPELKGPFLLSLLMVLQGRNPAEDVDILKQAKFQQPLKELMDTMSQKPQDVSEVMQNIVRDVALEARDNIDLSSVDWEEDIEFDSVNFNVAEFRNLLIEKFNARLATIYEDEAENEAENNEEALGAESETASSPTVEGISEKASMPLASASVSANVPSADATLTAGAATAIAASASPSPAIPPTGVPREDAIYRELIVEITKTNTKAKKLNINYDGDSLLLSMGIQQARNSLLLLNSRGLKTTTENKGDKTVIKIKIADLNNLLSPQTRQQMESRIAAASAAGSTPAEPILATPPPLVAATASGLVLATNTYKNIVEKLINHMMDKFHAIKADSLEENAAALIEDNAYLGEAINAVMENIAAKDESYVMIQEDIDNFAKLLLVAQVDEDDVKGLELDKLDKIDALEALKIAKEKLAVASSATASVVPSDSAIASPASAKSGASGVSTATETSPLPLAGTAALSAENVAQIPSEPLATASPPVAAADSHDEPPPPPLPGAKLSVVAAATAPDPIVVSDVKPVAAQPGSSDPASLSTATEDEAPPPPPPDTEEVAAKVAGEASSVEATATKPPSAPAPLTFTAVATGPKPVAGSDLGGLNVGSPILTAPRPVRPPPSEPSAPPLTGTASLPPGAAPLTEAPPAPLTGTGAVLPTPPTGPLSGSAPATLSPGAPRLVSGSAGTTPARPPKSASPSTPGVIPGGVGSSAGNDPTLVAAVATPSAVLQNRLSAAGMSLTSNQASGNSTPPADAGTAQAFKRSDTQAKDRMIEIYKQLYLENTADLQILLKSKTNSPNKTQYEAISREIQHTISELQSVTDPDEKDKLEKKLVAHSSWIESAERIDAMKKEVERKLKETNIDKEKGLTFFDEATQKKLEAKIEQITEIEKQLANMEKQLLATKGIFTKESDWGIKKGEELTKKLLEMNNALNSDKLKPLIPKKADRVGFKITPFLAQQLKEKKKLTATVEFETVQDYQEKSNQSIQRVKDALYKHNWTPTSRDSFFDRFGGKEDTARRAAERDELYKGVNYKEVPSKDQQTTATLEVILPEGATIKRNYDANTKKTNISVDPPEDRAILIMLDTCQGFKILDIKIPLMPNNKPAEKADINEDDMRNVLKAAAAAKLRDDQPPVSLSSEYMKILKEKFPDFEEQFKTIQTLQAAQLDALINPVNQKGEKEPQTFSLDELVEGITKGTPLNAHRTAAVTMGKAPTPKPP